MSNPFKKKKSKSASAKLLRNHRVLHAWRETILQISVQIARHIERATQVTQHVRGFLFADARGNSLGNMWTRAHVYLLWIIHAGVYVYMYIHVRAYVRTDARKLGCGIHNAMHTHRRGQRARILAVSVSLVSLVSPILFRDFSSLRTSSRASMQIISYILRVL